MLDNDDLSTISMVYGIQSNNWSNEYLAIDDWTIFIQFFAKFMNILTNFIDFILKLSFMHKFLCMIRTSKVTLMGCTTTSNEQTRNRKYTYPATKRPLPFAGDHSQWMLWRRQHQPQHHLTDVNFQLFLLGTFPDCRLISIDLTNFWWFSNLPSKLP